MTIELTMGERLLIARRRAGLSQAELAVILRISDRWLSAVENGEKNLDGNDLVAAERWLASVEHGGKGTS